MVLELNRTESPLSREERYKINENWTKIESGYNGIVDVVSTQAFEKVVDAAKLDWLAPVDTFADLATTYPNAVEGNASMAKDTGIVYRFDGTQWKPIQQIDATAINEVDTRLTDEINDIKEELLSNAVDLKRFGAVGDGVTDDTQAIQQAIDFAYSEGRAVKGENNTYLVSSITLKPNVYYLKGVTFLSNGMLTGNVYVVNCQQGVVVDEINVKLPTESTNERSVQVVSECNIDSIKISSDTQKSVFNDALDGALLISGTNITIGSIFINSFDYAVNIYNCSNIYINQIRCTSFVRGVYIRKSKGCNFAYISTVGKSPNATQSPGHNSLLIEECESLTFNSLNLSDAGEHAVRIGGIRDGLYLQKYLTFGNVITRRSGQCGFKSYTGDTNRISYIHVDNLTVIDCAYQNVPGENEDGLYLVGVDFAYIGNYRCVKELNGVSAYRGVYISSTNKVTIDNAEIWQTQATGITVDDAYGRVNDLHINTCTIRQVKAECILVDHDGFELRDIIFKNMYLREYGASNYGIKINVVSVYSPVLFDGYINTTGTLGAFQSVTTNGLIFNKMVVINAP